MSGVPVSDTCTIHGCHRGVGYWISHSRLPIAMFPSIHNYIVCAGLCPERGQAVPDFRIRRPRLEEVYGGHPGHARPHVGQGEAREYCRFVLDRQVTTAALLCLRDVVDVGRERDRKRGRSTTSPSSHVSGPSELLLHPPSRVVHAFFTTPRA